MKPAFLLRQSLQLTLILQLQQAIRLLQLSTVEINQEVARLLDENPMLEREEDATPAFTHGDTTVPAPPEKNDAAERDAPQEEWQKEDWNEASFAAASSPDDEDETRAEVISGTLSLREHLLWQLI